MMKRIIIAVSFVCLVACGKTGYDLSQNSEEESMTLETITLDNGLVFVKDGDYYSLDDMVFSPEINTKGVVTNNSVRYWPNGIVYYEFDAAASSTLINNTLLAMEELADSTGVHFFEATSTTTNYIHIQPGSGNNSYIGMKGGEQTINIKNSGYKYIIMHEIMHSLGFFHEQSRSDRDDYINVNWSNIKPEKVNNFQKQSANSVYDIGSFNFESIMLYSSWITDTLFVYNPSIPVMTKKDNSTFNANRSYLSMGDIMSVRAIYGQSYARLEEDVEIIQDYVSGIEEVYEADHEWTLRFYVDENYTFPFLTINQRYITLRKEVSRVGQNGNVVTTTTYEYVTIPAGTSSISLRTAHNTEIYLSSNPYNINYTRYFLQSYN